MLRFAIILIICFTSLHAIASPLKDAIIASKIVEINSGKVIYEHNAALPLNPASTLKVLTFYLALKNLDEDFQYKTEALADGRNLYIRFSGDPTLTMQDLDTLLAAALRKGFRFDAVYLDGDIFSQEHYAPGSCTDNLKFYYASPISAFSIDKNYVQLTQSKLGGLKYDSSSMLDLLKLQVKAIPAKDTNLCPLELFNTAPNEYLLDGCYDTIPPKLLIAITDPKKYARDTVTQLLKKHNVKVGKIEFGKASGKAVLLAEHKSKELKHLLREMMYKSDNHIADSLARFMAYKHFGKPASWFLVEKFLKSSIEQDLGIDMRQLQVVDGSGLSKKNYINANFMITLLEHIYMDLKIRKLFFESAPSFGSQDSTLQKRLLNLPGKIYAKTGSLDAASSLTGIVVGDNGRAYVFAIIINNFLNPDDSMKVIEEALLEEVLAKQLALTKY